MITRIGASKTSSIGPKIEIGGYILIVAVWLRGFLPGAINFLTDPHFSTEGIIQVERSQVSQIASVSTQILLILSLAVIFAFRSNQRVLVFGFWVIIALASLHYIPRLVNERLNLNLTINFLVLIAVTIAILRISWFRSHFALIAYLGVFTVGYSIALGVFLPSLAAFPGLAKNFLGTFLLAGSFGHANTLGLASLLVIGFLSAIPKLSIRLASLSIAAVGLIWSGSRTAFLAAILVALFWILRQVIIDRKSLTIFLSLSVMFVCVSIPLLTTDYEAFTRRGRIWLVSLNEIGHSFLFGLGPDWYELQALYATDLGTQASSGHNLFIHLFTTGGIILVALLFLVLVSSAQKSLKVDFYQTPYSYWLISFLAISIAEYAFVYSVYSDLFFFTTFPLLVFFLGKPKMERE